MNVMWEVCCQPYIIATYKTGSFIYWRCATNSCGGLILKIYLFVAGWFHECDNSISVSQEAREIDREREREFFKHNSL
jgi:hypothetical protein